MLEVLSMVVGLVGIGFGLYLFYRRPSVLLIPIIITVSTLIIVLGQTLSFIWLANNGEIGYATVTNLDCRSGQKHHIHYQFSVGRILVDDIGPDGYGNHSCESIRIGDQGLVTYVANEPTIHVWGRAREYLTERLVVCLLVLVLLPIISYFGVQKRISELHEP